MVPKAVPIYASDQSDVFWLAPKAGRVGRSAFGPFKQRLPPGDPINKENREAYLLVKDSLMQILMN